MVPETHALAAGFLLSQARANNSLLRFYSHVQVATTIEFPCKYASSGCDAMLRYLQKQNHEDVCERRPYSCPCPGASCKWQGSLDEVMPHLMTAHKSITNLQVCCSVRICLCVRDLVYKCFSVDRFIICDKLKGFGKFLSCGILLISF